MAIYVYTNSPGEEGQPLIPGDYTLLRGPCDEGFHVPLKEEFESIKNAGITATQFKTNLHIPLAGRRASGSGNWEQNDSVAHLWSSTPDVGGSSSLLLDSSTVTPDVTNGTSFGFSVRGFRNTPIIPDQDRTETVTGKVWYNSTLGLISVLVGTNKYITLQDKNVGATGVYNGTLNANNRGNYFQRGNNYGFKWSVTGSISSNRIDASGYGPSNPYSSSTFIKTNYDRSTVENDNLRGYTDFNS